MDILRNFESMKKGKTANRKFEKDWNKAQEVFDWMKMHEMEPNPEMYELWYTYFSDPITYVAINKILRKKKIDLQNLDSDFCYFLYNLLCGLDGLTKIPNRKGFNNELKQATQHSNNSEDHLCLIIIDLDDFKNLNDKYGHWNGDIVLREISKLLKKNTKGQDFVARIGGEEFGIILPGTKLENAAKLAKKLLKSVKETPIELNSDKLNQIFVTISLGVAQYMKEEQINDFFTRSDKALYDAKKDGKGCAYLWRYESYTSDKIE